MKKQSEHLFKIGEIAKILGVTRKAILVYEEMGLLTPAVKDEASGYRYYTADNMTQIRAIRSLQTLGLSLAEIREYYYDTENLDRYLDRLMDLRATLDRNIHLLQLRAAKPGDLSVHRVRLPRQVCFCRRYQCTDAKDAAIKLRIPILPRQNRKNVHGEPHVYCTCRFLLQGTRSAMLHPCFRRFCG